MFLASWMRLIFFSNFYPTGKMESIQNSQRIQLLTVSLCIKHFAVFEKFEFQLP